MGGNYCIACLLYTSICRKANLIEPLQEPIYLYMFTAMQQLGMKKAILNYYPITANLFYDELGERLCAEIRQIYFWASEGTNLIEQDLQQIQEDLAEITKDQRPIRGAYFCPYEMVKHIYHMVARSAERAGNNVVLLLLTCLLYTSPFSRGPSGRPAAFSAWSPN